jgi:hypothetical protein
MLSLAPKTAIVAKVSVQEAEAGKVKEVKQHVNAGIAND